MDFPNQVTIYKKSRTIYLDSSAFFVETLVFHLVSTLQVRVGREEKAPI